MKRRVLTPRAGRATVLAMIAVTVFHGVMAQGRPDPLTNPNAVAHRIDRSAMAVPLQGWSRDLRYPVYPIQVQRGANAVYYTTNEHVDDYLEFDFHALRCEIGDADRAVLTLKGYACADGVCTTAEGAVLGTDPRRPVTQKPC